MVNTVVATITIVRAISFQARSPLSTPNNSGGADRHGRTSENVALTAAAAAAALLVFLTGYHHSD